MQKLWTQPHQRLALPSGATEKKEDGRKLITVRMVRENAILKRCSCHFLQFTDKSGKYFAKVVQRMNDLKHVLADVGLYQIKFLLAINDYVTNQKGTVELGIYKKQHPFTQLSGSDKIITFTTE
nr:bifunctional aspartokinase/homoserine dehydrogenase, chloroplastic-like [Tanacetum cinerariifolium]